MSRSSASIIYSCNKNDMPSGVTALGDMARQFLEKITVSRNCRDRPGRLRSARLLAEYGEVFPGPALRRVLATDCPRMIEGNMHDVCGIHFPGLGG
jgi:hypothetical protein